MELKPIVAPEFGPYAGVQRHEVNVIQGRAVLWVHPCPVAPTNNKNRTQPPDVDQVALKILITSVSWSGVECAGRQFAGGESEGMLALQGPDAFSSANVQLPII